MYGAMVNGCVFTRVLNAIDRSKTNGSTVMLYDTKNDLSQDSQDLLNAADYIDQKGWCQKKTHDPNGEVCLWGSLLAVTEGLDKYYHTAPRAAKLYNMVIEHLGTRPDRWNDDPVRTKTEVTALLRNLALKSKE